MFDSHCHPTDIEDAALCLAAARQGGVVGVLACGYHDASNRAVLALRTAEGFLPIALGLHPWFAAQPIEPVIALIESQHPVAIGECGVDGCLAANMPKLSQQIVAFETQLNLASRLHLPLTVHNRGSVALVMDLLRAFPAARGALHAFSGSYEQARLFVDRGWYIGIGGAVTHPEARRVRRMAQKLPLDSIVLETDAPAIGLLGVPKGTSRPAHVLQIAQALADLRGQPLDGVVSATDANAASLFGREEIFGTS